MHKEKAGFRWRKNDKFHLAIDILMETATDALWVSGTQSWGTQDEQSLGRH